MTAAVAAPAAFSPPVGARTCAYRGLRLDSAFQPIVSLSHRRVVGHEGLLRASDADGRAVPPLQVLALAAGAAAEARLDADCLRLHLANFGRQAQGAQWLFVNLRPGTFLRGAREPAIAQLLALLREQGVAPQQLVIEVTEDAVADPSAFESAAQAARETGCLLALDDFGAGHSNFDRVWRIRPDIVKLDRSQVQRAALDAGVARVVAQMVSLLHQCGALVLMEGIETADEAHVALDCDVDLVQGYRFGRPMPQLQGTERLSRPLVDAWSQFERRARDGVDAHRARITPYLNAIGHGGGLLGAGRSVEAASASFLALPGAQLCYLLDDNGVQHGTNVIGAGRRARAVDPRFAPLQDAQQACWARRPYFRRAIASPGEVQVTRPYLSLQGAQLCVTLSVALLREGRRFVFCGDLAWS